MSSPREREHMKLEIFELLEKPYIDEQITGQLFL
jgi:hypothetical protein